VALNTERKINTLKNKKWKEKMKDPGTEAAQKSLTLLHNDRNILNKRFS
jgi:hypothetical protein